MLTRAASAGPRPVVVVPVQAADPPDPLLNARGKLSDQCDTPHRWSFPSGDGDGEDGALSVLTAEY